MAMVIHFHLIIGCSDIDTLEDGYCDDENNIEECFFDGGDCCGTNVDTFLCTVCECLDPDFDRFEDYFNPFDVYQYQDDKYGTSC